MPDAWARLIVFSVSFSFDATQKELKDDFLEGQAWEGAEDATQKELKEVVDEHPDYESVIGCNSERIERYPLPL